MQDITLILLSAGTSSRFNASPKKQWLYQDNIPLWLYVAQKFQKEFSFFEIIIVSSSDEIPYMKQFADFTYVAGGNTRQKSVQNAIGSAKSQYVLISDVARCCIDVDMVQRVANKRSQAKCIAPALQVTDTVYNANTPINREGILLIQTPQVCNTATLKSALKSNQEFTDESTAIQSLGETIIFVEGSPIAHKLTHQHDLYKLPCLQEPSNDTMIGFGVDIHAFEHNKPLKLCGVSIDSPVGLKAHSDGDVAIHALIDALLGASNLGDIGELFPDTDPTYINIDSSELLDTVVSKIKGYGFDIVNADITIMAEKPKLSKYKKQMQEKIAKHLQLPLYKVNIKATTAEKLGFVGREEGIAVHAATSIKYYNWKKNI